MKGRIVSFPVYFENSGEGFTVVVPALGNFTQGENLEDAIYMAEDLIGIVCVTYQDKGFEIPKSESISEYCFDFDPSEYDIIKNIEVDLDEYRERLKNMVFTEEDLNL